MQQFHIIFIVIVILSCFCSNMIQSLRVGRGVTGGIFSVGRRARLSSISAIGETTYAENTLRPFRVLANPNFTNSCEMLVIPFYSRDGKEGTSLDIAWNKLPNNLSHLISQFTNDNTKKLQGKNIKRLITLHPSVEKLKYIALVGLGPQTGQDEDGMSAETAENLGKLIVSCAKDSSANSISILTPQNAKRESITQLLVGLHDDLYADNRFKKNESNPPTFDSIEFFGCDHQVTESISEMESFANQIASGVNLAKDLVGAPSNVKTPLLISNVARELASHHQLEVKILGEEECKALGMGGYLAVQQGSKFPPQFIHLTYKPKNPNGQITKIALIGKGLTFDSGGYNLKTGTGSMIELMKFDMGGCAAILGCAKTIAQIKPQHVEVHFITAVCENMISSNAARPGDIVKASNGKTIEILNTDAEGRLTLADALVYAEKLEVNAIIDLATLTGACIVGLGENLAGLFSNENSLRSSLEKASKLGNEGMWNLPLEKSYLETIKGGLADLKNIGSGKGGGSITAALFLSEFITKTPWAHIDMAGPVWNTKANKPTGFGVKTLVHFLLDAENAKLN